MKLALVYNEYEGVSGETVFFRNMVQAMKRRGFDITCCAIRQPAAESIAGLASHYLRYPLLCDTYDAIKGCAGHDIIHFLNSPLCPAGRAIKGPRKLATAHFFSEAYLSMTRSGMPLSAYAEKCYAAYVSRMDKEAFRSLDRLVSCGRFAAKSIKEAYGIEKVDVIYPGIDTDLFKRAKRVDLRSRYDCDEAIVYLGRLNERAKCVSDLIRAMGMLERKGAKLIIIGDGPDRRRYESLSREIGISEKVVFTGAIEFNAKTVIQKSADLIAIPSRYEVYGTVFAESMACSVPVVAYDLPFWKGMYDGAGLLVEPGPRTLADGIARILDDKALRKRLVDKGAKLTPEHSFSKTEESYCRLYEELCSQRRVGGK